MFKLDSLPKEDKTVLKPKFTNIDLNVEQINTKLKVSTDMNKDDMVTMIRNSYQVILDDIFLRSRENRQNIIDVFKNPSFVSAFSEVMKTVELNYSQRICCNKLAWDYMTSDDNNPEIKDALFHLSDTVNRKDVQVLSASIPIDLARYLSLARYSSFNETKNIERANTILIKAAKNLTEQTVIDIYSILFKHNFSNTFQVIMFDNLKSICVTEEQKENNSLISICILDILENMPSNDIGDILSAYVETYRLCQKEHIRFGIRSISTTDYPRILHVVDCLEYQRNIVVP